MIAQRRLRAAYAADRSSRAKHRPVKDGRGTGEGLKTIYGPGCWCGEPFGHGWEGKDNGQPHPR